jgi:hypothetical protein
LAAVSSAPPPEEHHGLFGWLSDAVSSGAHAVADTASGAYHGAVDLGSRAINTVERGASAVEGAVVGGVHSAENAIDRGSHALAARVGNVPVLGSVARSGANLVSGAAHLEGSLVEGAAHAAAHPLDTARSVVNTVDRGANAVSHGVDVAEGAVRTGMHHAEDWVDHGTHALADRVSNVPVLGAAAHSVADSITGDVQFAGGVVEGATDMVGGLVNTAVHPINTAKGLEAVAEHGGIPGVSTALRAGHDLIDGKSLSETANRAFNPLDDSTRREDTAFWGNMGHAIIEPYAQSVREGRPMEAAGHLGFDVASMFVGAGEAGDAARVAEVASDASRVTETTRAATLAADASRASDVTHAVEVAGETDRAVTVAHGAQVTGDVDRASEATRAATTAGDASATRAAENAAPLSQDTRTAEQLSTARNETEHVPPIEAHAEAPRVETPPETTPPTTAPPDLPPPDTIPPERAPPEPQGPRGETREQYRARRSRERAEETVRRADQPLENPNLNKAQHGHGHAWHGSQTTEAQQAERVRTGVTPTGEVRKAPGRASRYSSPQAEAEALGRGRRALQSALKAGTEDERFTDAAGQVTHVNPATGEPARHTTVVPTNRPEGYGTSQVVRRHAPPSDQVLKDASGQRVAQPSSTPLPNAAVHWEYVKSTGEWRRVTSYPEPAALPSGATNLR